jgi:hypothetical protein
MNNKIPTVEEILKNKETYDEEYLTVSISDATEAMIEFAKLHCAAQLKAILENVKTKSDVAIFQEGQYTQTVMNKDSIINAYDLNQIK